MSWPPTAPRRDRTEQRVAAIADLHGNQLALEAVIADIGAQGIEEIAAMASGLPDARRACYRSDRRYASSFIGSAVCCLSWSKLHCLGALSGRQRRIEVPWRKRSPLK